MLMLSLISLAGAPEGTEDAVAALGREERRVAFVVGTPGAWRKK